MGQDRQQQIRYKRSRFSTRLPVDRRYTASHFWTVEQQSGLWRVGMGWLYSVSGTPESNSVDVQGYVEILDLTIDKMREQSGYKDGNE